MSEKAELMSMDDVKKRLTGRIREDIGNMISQEEIDKLIAEAKNEAINEIKEDVKKMLKEAQQNTVHDTFQKYLSDNDLSNKWENTTRDSMVALMQEAGFDSLGLLLMGAQKELIRKLHEELRNYFPQLPYAYY